MKLLIMQSSRTFRYYLPLRLFQIIRSISRPYVTFHNSCFLLRWGVVSPLLGPKLEDHSLSAVRDCLFNILAATLHIWRLCPPHPKDAPRRGNRHPY
jgi:hypothetical protein